MMDQIDWACLQRMYDARFAAWGAAYGEGMWVVRAMTAYDREYIGIAPSLERAVGRLFEDLEGSGDG